MLASSVCDRFCSADPMDWKAALLGAKMVTSRVESTASTRLVRLRAPCTAVRFAALVVLRIEVGSVRKRSTTWRTPPVKFRSWGAQSLSVF